MFSFQLENIKRKVNRNALSSAPSGGAAAVAAVGGVGGSDWETPQHQQWVGEHKQLVSVVSRKLPFLKSCCSFHLERGGAKLQVAVGRYGNAAVSESRDGPGWRITEPQLNQQRSEWC